MKSAVEAGYGVTFISRAAVEAELTAGRLATARVRGLEPSRQISLVRASGRVGTRLSEAFVDFASTASDGDSLGSLRAVRPARRARNRAAVPRGERPLVSRSAPRRGRRCLVQKCRPTESTMRSRPRVSAMGCSSSVGVARSTSRRPSRPARGCPWSRFPPRTRARVDGLLRRARQQQTDAGRRIRGHVGRRLVRARVDDRTSPRGDGRHRAERPRTQRGGVLRQGPERTR